MHKDKPPGIFDLNDRSIGYVIGFGLIVGFLLSAVVMAIFIVASDDFTRISAPWSSR